MGVDFLFDELLVLRVIALHEDDGGIVLRTKQCAQGADGQIFASTLAVLDNAANAKWVVEKRDRIAHLVMLTRPGEDVVDNDFVGSLKWAAGEKNERTQRVVAGIVDAPNCLYAGLHG